LCGLDSLPRLRRKLLYADRDTPLLAVDRQDFDLNLLIDRKHLVRMLEVASDIGYMTEAVNTAEIDESSKTQ